MWIFKNWIALLFLVLLVNAASAATNNWVNLNSKGEIKVSDSSSLDGFSKATWNVWVKQTSAVDKAGLVGKYAALTGKRSYLIRTTNTSSVYVILSSDGVNTGTYSSAPTKSCGIKDDKWTMLTVTYDGSLITYYRNGVKCDVDSTSISSIYNSPTELRFGGGNNIYFNGGIDEYSIYDNTLVASQVKRLYDESSHGANLGTSIPVLVYHRIESNPDDTIKVSPSQFQLQMQFLKNNDFKTITLKQYLDWRKGKFTMPSKPVILVFDDGWATVYTQALPVMNIMGFVGSVAAVKDYVSGVSGGPEYMHSSEIKTLVSKGWSIESHGVQHAHMLTLSESEFRTQLNTSKSYIASLTGITPTSFIFPFHEANSDYTSICAEYYSLCWTQGSLNPSYDFKSTPANTYLSLRRINVANTTSITDFANYLSKDTNIAGNWEMDEGNGETVSDNSGHSNVGSLFGTATWSTQTIPLLATTSEILMPELITEKMSTESAAVESVVDSDLGKTPLRVLSENTYPENMQIEQDKHYPEYKHKKKKDKNHTDKDEEK